MILSDNMRRLLLALDQEEPRRPVVDGVSAWATADALAQRRLAREVQGGFVLTADGVWERRLLKRKVPA